MSIRLFVLGGLRLTLDEAEVEGLTSQRLRAALLVYLALERVATRDALQAVFWPETDADTAAHRLSQNVYALRTSIADDAVETHGRELRAGARLGVDAAEFEAAHLAGRHADALALYRGPFLAGVHLASSNAFESWLDHRRTLYARQFRKSCRALLDERLADGDLAGALAVAQAWVAPDPQDDEAQHRLIETLARTSGRTDALAQYDAYARLLEADGLEPLDETRTLRAGIERMASAPADATFVAGDPRPALQAPVLPTAVQAPLVRRPLTWAAGLGAVALIGLTVTMGDDRPAGPAPPDPDDVVGVLPVQAVSGSGDLGGFAKAFEARLAGELRDVRGLVLVPPEAIGPRHTDGWPLDSIAAALAVDYFLKTLISSTGDSLTIDLQLIGADGQAIAGTATLREPMATDPFTLLDEVGRRSAELLRQALGVQVERQRLAEGTRNPRALMLRYDAEAIIDLLFARLGEPGTREQVERLIASADSLLRDSQRLDPSWNEPAMRRAVLAELRAHNLLANSTDVDLAEIRALYDHGIDVVNDVLARDRTDADALALRGRLRWLRALQGNPNVLDDGGLVALAEADLRAALREDPSHAQAAASLSGLLNRLGSFEEAAVFAQRAWDNDRYMAGNSSIINALARSRFELGHDEEAAAFCAEGRRRYPENPASFGCTLELMAWGTMAPDADSARIYLEAVMERSSQNNRPGLAAFYSIAVAAVLARAGAADSALAVVARNGREARAAYGDALPASALARTAGVYHRLGDGARAEELLAELRERYPDDAPALERSRVLRDFTALTDTR